MGKPFTSCIHNRINEFLDATGTIGAKQAGFRAEFGTTGQIFALHTIINLYLSEKKRLYTVFVDYEKAFDTIKRS